MKNTNKDYVLAIRLSDADKYAIMQCAEYERLSMSSWARNILIQKIKEWNRENENKIELD